MDFLDKMKELATKVNLNIVVKDYTFWNDLPQEVNYIFWVTSEEEYESALECEEKYRLEHTEIVPVYTGDNLSFFQDFLYMDEESIEEFALDKREVFIRQKLNIQDFGRLTIMTDGKVYANPNHPAIGHIVPTGDSEFVGKASLPIQGSGKVRTGQRAVIRLSGFPEQEYGGLEGEVVSISPVPNEEGNYVVEIRLTRMPDKQPPVLKVMNGTAEIVICEQSLLERLFKH